MLIKKTKAIGWLFLLILCGATSNTLAQEKVYISDILYVPLRSGAGNEFRIISTNLKSGAVLTRLGVSDDGEWTHVTTDKGTEGWVRSQYVLVEPPATIKLARLEVRAAKLEKENTRLNAENKQLSEQLSQVSNEAQTELSQREKMAARLKEISTLSAGAIELDKRHKELLQKHQLLQTERDTLAAENENLKTDQRMSFLFYGAGLLILGMIISVILPHLKPKRRYSEWS